MPRDDRPKYALDPVREVRAAAERSAREALARAVEAREAATRSRRSAEAEREDADRRATAARAGEQALLASGALSVADLGRHDAWEAGVREARAADDERIVQLSAREVEASHVENLRRSELGDRMRALELVEKDKERWEDARRRRREAADEAEGADAWRPKRA